MNVPTREQLETRMHAIVADLLDQIAEGNPEGFDLGIVALAVEVITPDPEGAWIRREEGGYWPPMDVNMHQHLYCTDWRRWVKKAFFRMASEAYEDPSSDESGGNDFESEISRLSDEYERLNDEVSRTLKRFHPPEDGEVEEST